MNRIGFLLLCAEIGMLAAWGQMPEARNDHQPMNVSQPTFGSMAVALKPQQRVSYDADGGTAVLSYRKLACCRPANVSGLEEEKELKGEWASLSGQDCSVCEQRYTTNAPGMKTKLMASTTATRPAGLLRENAE